VYNTEDSHVLNLFNSFKQKSNDLGANAYHIEKVKKETSPW